MCRLNRVGLIANDIIRSTGLSLGEDVPVDLTTIRPFQGLGDLQFGMQRATVREMLGQSREGFHKAGAPEETDAYDNFGFHLYYDEDDALEYMETYPPCDPVFDGIHLFHGQPSEIVQQLEGKGHRLIQDDVGYDLPDAGFGLYIPYESIEAVSIYRRGLYDQQR